MILFFDTETTGMVNFRIPEDHPDQPRLVQVAALLVDVEGRTVGQIDAIVEPVGFAIPRAATAIHGITTEHACASGVDIRSALSLFGQFCQRATLVVAHNVAFDVAVMRAEYRRAGLADRVGSLRRYCTMRAAMKLVKYKDARGRRKWPTLSETYRHFYGVDLAGAHDAMSDVIACRRCFEGIEGGRRRDERQLGLLDESIGCDMGRYPELDAILE